MPLPMLSFYKYKWNYTALTASYTAFVVGGALGGFA